MIAAGYDNGDVKMWDLRNMKLYWDTNVGNGVCSLEYDRRDIKVSTCLQRKHSVFVLSLPRCSWVLYLL